MLNSFFLSFERGRMLSFFACGQGYQLMAQVLVMAIYLGG
jgi:hypothetical protein